MDKKKEYFCTECGGDATIGLSDYKDIRGKKPIVIIKKEERLCPQCAKKRGADFFKNWGK